MPRPRERQLADDREGPVEQLTRQRYVAINLHPRERWGSALAGAALAALGLRLGTPARAAAVLGGAVLLARGLSGHCPV